MTRSRIVLVFVLLLLVGGGLAAYLALRPGPPDPASDYAYGRPDRARLPKMTLLNHSSVMSELFGEPAMKVETLGILVYDGVDTLEAIAPMVVFSELSNVKLEYIGVRAGRVQTRLVEIEVERSFQDIEKLDLLVVPGGEPAAVAALASVPELAGWLQRMDGGTQLTAGIGNGVQVLTSAQIPLPPSTAERYGHQGKYWQASGATAALDVSLAMLQAIVGDRYLQAAMLDLEYAPQPPDLAAMPPASTPTAATALEVGILVYPDFFKLDAIGPLAVLSGIEGLNVRLIRYGDAELIKSGRTRFYVPVTTRDVSRLDVLIVPGGSTGTWALSQDPEALNWIRGMDAGSRVTASVCTGSWVLGAAGLLRDRRASSNWYRAEQVMSHFGATFEPKRYVQDEKYWTSAGVSAGMDLSFALIAELRGKEAAREALLRLNYNPSPPLDAGTPEKTEDLVLDMMHQMYDYQMLSLLQKEGIVP